MMNIIRADTYRILRGKGIYISLAVLIVVITLGSLTGGTIGLSSDGMVIMDETIEAIENNSTEQLSAEREAAFRAPTGLEAVNKATSSSNNVLFFLLPLVIFVSIVDFSSGGAKNTLAGGVNRVKYYFSKLILSFVLFAVFLLVYVLLFVLLASIFNGFGGTFNGAFIAGLVRILLPQLWLGLAGVCVAHFFAFLFRSSAFVGVYIAFLVLPLLLIYTLTFANEWFVNLLDYELTMNIGLMAHIDMLSSGDVIKVILIGAGYIVAAVIGGFAVFRKAEIK